LRSTATNEKGIAALCGLPPRLLPRGTFPSPRVLHPLQCQVLPGAGQVWYRLWNILLCESRALHRFRTLHCCQAEGPVLWRREVLHILEISADQLKSLLAPSKEQSAIADMVSTIFPLPLELQLTFVERYVGGYDRGRSTNRLPLPYPSSNK
jgi:hypothetical protein